VAARTLAFQALSCIDTVYVHREPDDGGETFVPLVVERLREIGYQGLAFELTMPDGVKDPADLHAADADGFEAALARRVELSRPLGRPAAAACNGKLEDKPQAEAEPDPEPVLKTLSDVSPLAVEWLWRHWIPAGMLSILDGDPGLGKSQLTLDLAARVSRGWAMPPGGGAGGEPASVLLLSAEDDLERTIRPRLDAAGADVSRVFALDGFKTGPGEDDQRPAEIPWDLDRIARLCQERGVRLLAIDPFAAYIGGQYDTHKDSDTRRVMHRLHRFAVRYRVTTLLVRHLNKYSDGKALYRGTGSIAIAGAARCALVVGHDPADRSRRVLAMNKTNLGPMPPSLTYTLERVGPDVTRLAWGGECDLTPEDILARPTAPKGPPEEDLRESDRWLLSFLQGCQTQGKGATAREVYCEGAKEGYSEATLDRSKARLKIRSVKGVAAWYWTLPEGSRVSNHPTCVARDTLEPDTPGQNGESGQEPDWEDAG